jgi:hypothetical protein
MSATADSVEMLVQRERTDALQSGRPWDRTNHVPLVQYHSGACNLSHACPHQQSALAIIMLTVFPQAFLSGSTQLTYHGLSELHGALTPGQLAVFFRNNHFCECLLPVVFIFTSGRIPWLLVWTSSAVKHDTAYSHLSR